MTTTSRTTTTMMTRVMGAPVLGPVSDPILGGRSGQPEVLQAEDVPVLEAGGGELLGRPGRAVGDRRDGDHRGPGLLGRARGIQRGRPGGRGVLDHEHPSTLDRGSLDALL